MKKFSVIIAHRHATSISLEEEFYTELTNLATEKCTTINELITEIDYNRTTENLSSAIRLYILQSLKEKINQQML